MKCWPVALQLVVICSQALDTYRGWFGTRRRRQGQHESQLRSLSWVDKSKDFGKSGHCTGTVYHLSDACGKKEGDILAHRSLSLSKDPNTVVIGLVLYRLRPIVYT